jgi:ABC-2 type transport system permease protein
VSKFWRVVAYEYQRHVLRRRFLFALLSVPAIVGVMALIVLLLNRAENTNTPIGYVDYSGVLAQAVQPPQVDPLERPVPIIRFESEAQAKESLQAGKLQAYYILPSDYLQTSRAELVFIHSPGSSVQSQFRNFLRVNLLKTQSQAIVERITEGNNLVVRSVDGSRQMSQKDWFNILTPFMAGLVFVIAIFMTSGYLMQAVVEEKENRTMEILLTSVSPLQLMSGKIVGIVGVGITQLLAWIGFAIGVVIVGRNYLTWLEGVQIAPSALGAMAVVMLPGFLLIAALMATIGATVTEASEGQQMTGLITLPVMLPYWFSYLIMSNPNGPVAMVLSYFPLTAPVALSLRMGFTQVPLRELFPSLISLTVFALGALWLAGRAFRLGMLRYGQRVTLREIFSRNAAEAQ